VLQFVIDTTGQVDKRTIRLVRSTHPEFALAVLHGLALMRYGPAEVDGGKVKELVEQPFAFSMRR